MSTSRDITCIALLLMIVPSYIIGGRQSMKLVDEPSNYGMNFGGGYNANQDTGPAANALKMRVPPSNFSGPDHLKILRGKCFTLVNEEYKYEFCPFSNLTQHEQSLRWNPYSGILGIWQEWEIENNTFVAMVMREGDKCGSSPRSARILLNCGNKTRVASVSEPNKCQYEVDFRTPLVCHRRSLLVYPTLSQELQHEWDILETQYQEGELTYQGYRKFLRAQVFEKAGYCLKEETLQKIAEEAQHVDEVKAKHEQGEYETLEECTEELKKLKEKVKKYQDMLEVNGINPENGKKERDDNDMDPMPGADGDFYDSHQDYYQDYNHDML